MATNAPMCFGCQAPVRPCVNLKHDMDWDERDTQIQEDNFNKWYAGKSKRSCTVLEIGAGPV